MLDTLTRVPEPQIYAPEQQSVREEIEFGAYTLNIWTRRVTVGDRWIKLTECESVVFRAIAERPFGATYAQIQDALVAFDGRPCKVDSRLYAIQYLRKKLALITPPGFVAIPDRRGNSVHKSQRVYMLMQPPNV